MVYAPALADMHFYGKYQTLTCMYVMLTLLVTLFILLDPTPPGVTESLVCHYYNAMVSVVQSYYYLMIRA